MPPATLFTDADNTLWDTDRVFAAAQLALLETVEAATGAEVVASDRLAFVRSLDQGIAGRHHAGLRYPPRLLARALALDLAGADTGRAVRLALVGGEANQRLSETQAAAAELAFVAAIQALPPLRLGVEEGLEALHAAGCLILMVTEGARDKIAGTAAAHGIARFIDRIIESPKRPDLYRRVLRLTPVAGRASMVGDQLDRDIAPAKSAGLETIWFPGGFRPRWEPEVEEVAPDHVVTSFREVLGIVTGQTPQEDPRADRGGPST